MSDGVSKVEYAAMAAGMSTAEYADAVESATRGFPEAETMTPYTTGVCPACGQQVTFAECDISVPPGAYVETIRGRWICRTIGCRYGEPTVANGAA